MSIRGIIWRAIEHHYTPKNSDPFVVVGFPRSGTSIVAHLVAECGVDFGPLKTQRRPDWRNPMGFFEHIQINEIDKALMCESRTGNPLIFKPTSSLRASGLRYRVSRLCTRVKMLRVLKHLSATEKHAWGLKLFPSTFYFWNMYIPNAKVIAVYRDPRSAAYSNQKSFNRFTFAQLLQYWHVAHMELLYHLSSHKHFLIKLEDLEDSTTRGQILKNLVDFVGFGSVCELEAIFTPTQKKNNANDILNQIPLQADTQHLLNTLNSLRS